MRRLVEKWTRVALAAWLVAVTGCGMAPTAPQPSSGADGQQLAAASGGTPARDEQPAPAPVAISQPAPHPQPDPVDGDNEVWKPVSGQVGTTLQAGLVTVTIPAAAIDGAAEVRISVPNPDQLLCHLEILPAEKNSFAVPVTLEFDAKSLEDPRAISIFWLNEETNQWEAIASAYDPATRKISAELPHFSFYRVDTELRGRAGW